jgi:hypothetical protein
MQAVTCQVDKGVITVPNFSDTPYEKEPYYDHDMEFMANLVNRIS